MSRNVRKRTFWHVSSKDSVWSESSLDAYLIAKNVKFLHAVNEDGQADLSPRRVHVSAHITKTRLFKYIDNFTTKNLNFSDKKSLIFFIFLLKT